MKWVVQTDVPRSNNRDLALKALAELDVEFLPLAVMQDDWTETAGDWIAGDDVLVYGSTRLTKHAAASWRPGAYLGESFEYYACLAGWGDLMLNSDAKVATVEDLEFEGPMFVRPVSDSKLFGGEIVDGRRLRFWKEVRMSENPNLRPETPVIAAPLKKIDMETRCFIVGGRVAAASRYMFEGSIDVGRPDPAAIRFAGECADLWKPHDNFVLDVASTGDGFRVLEVNCINSSGLYACDPNAVFGGLTRYIRNSAENSHENTRSVPIIVP